MAALLILCLVHQDLKINVSPAVASAIECMNGGVVVKVTRSNNEVLEVIGSGIARRQTTTEWNEIVYNDVEALNCRRNITAKH